MLKKYIYYLRQILPILHNSWLSALLLLIACSSFMLFTPFSKHLQNILHGSFFVLNLASIFLLARYNRNQPLFFIIIMTLVYILINHLKLSHGVIYYLSPAYLNMIFLAGTGLLFFYFLPNQAFYSTDTTKFLILIFTAFALGELLSDAQIQIDIRPITYFGSGLQIFGLSLLSVVFLTMMFHASVKDDILQTSLTYAFINIALGLYFSPQPSALALFFTTAAATIFLAVVRQIYFILHKDIATGLDNGRSFISKAKKLPLKYGLGIICIDDYTHLLQAFRRNGIGDIMLMISKKIRLLEPDALLYRCTPDEFIIIFPNAEKGTSFQRVDEIRRQIAASEFILNRIKRPLKITVSCSIAEKKRSDGNIGDVFIRAHRVLQNTYKFTQNITSRA